MDIIKLKLLDTCHTESIIRFIFEIKRHSINNIKFGIASLTQLLARNDTK